MQYEEETLYIHLHSPQGSTINRKTLTKNKDCDQSNILLAHYFLVYSPKAALSFLSLHIVVRRAIIHEISLQSPIISVSSDVYCPRAKYIVNRVTRCRDTAI